MLLTLGTSMKCTSQSPAFPIMYSTTGTVFLNFRSESAVFFCVILLFGSTTMTYTDQASWQSRIAAKPTQGVIGFFLGALIWFAIPSTFATASGIPYLIKASTNKSHFLSAEEINGGFVSLVMCWELLGEAGAFLILAMGAMAIMSTGSGEVMGVSSILMYDVYQIYIRPFRKGCTSEHCILCGLLRQHSGCGDSGESLSDDDTKVCTCISVYNCEACRVDCAAEATSYGKQYQCQTHGNYRHYQDRLIRCKNWCILSLTLFMVPFAMVLFNIGVDLTWIITAGVTFTVGFSPGVYLSVGWAKTTGSGIVAGGLSGLLAGVAVSLALASTYEGGLSNFFKNTVEIYPSLCGCIVGFGVSLIVCVVVSFCTHKIKSEADAKGEWRKTTNIGNPLRPWELAFLEEFPEILDGFLPSHDDLTKTFKAATRLSLMGAAIGGGLMVFVMPGILISLEVLSEQQFTTWLYLDHISTLVIFVPPIEEAFKIWKQYKRRLKKLQLSKCDVSDIAADPAENIDTLL